MKSPSRRTCRQKDTRPAAFSSRSRGKLALARWTGNSSLICQILRPLPGICSGWHRAFGELSFGEFAQESSAFLAVKKLRKWSHDIWSYLDLLGSCMKQCVHAIHNLIDKSTVKKNAIARIRWNLIVFLQDTSAGMKVENIWGPHPPWRILSRKNPTFCDYWDFLSVVGNPLGSMHKKSIRTGRSGKCWNLRLNTKVIFFCNDLFFFCRIKWSPINHFPTN